MHKDEFNDWLAHHMAHFPGIQAWLQKFDQQAKATPGDRAAVTAQSILRRWRSTLEDIDLKDAVAASDAMARGDADEPRSFGEHARAVRKYATKETAPARAEIRRNSLRFDGEETFKCAACRDTGIVTVWHPSAVKAASEGKLFNRVLNPEGSLPPYSAAAACTCEAGYPKRSWLAVKTEFMPDFDSGIESGWTGLMEFVASAADRRAASYQFDPAQYQYPGAPDEHQGD